VADEIFCYGIQCRSSILFFSKYSDFRNNFYFIQLFYIQFFHKIVKDMHSKIGRRKKAWLVACQILNLKGK
jgi:hypothetical protein